MDNEQRGIQRDSTLDMVNFTAYISRTNVAQVGENDPAVGNRRGTELLPPSLSDLGRDNSFKLTAKPISLNIEAVIKTKQGLQNSLIVKENPADDCNVLSFK